MAKRLAAPDRCSGAETALLESLKMPGTICDGAHEQVYRRVTG